MVKNPFIFVFMTNIFWAVLYINIDIMYNVTGLYNQALGTTLQVTHSCWKMLLECCLAWVSAP